MLFMWHTGTNVTTVCYVIVNKCYLQGTSLMEMQLQPDYMSKNSQKFTNTGLI